MQKLSSLILATVTLLGSGSAVAQVCGEVPKVLIVLDRSGSMKEQVNGQSKWDIAKSAVTGLAQQFSTQLALGLMLYPSWPEKSACATGTVNVDPAVASETQIVTALNSAFPSGNTPIAATLDAASAYLSSLSTKMHHVILVSDGKETCLLPPAPLSATGSCAWENGTNYRKCGGCGWQFCLASGTWSSACEAKPELFTCATGQTCGTNALCSGTATGSATAKKAAAALAAQGIKTHVIGFGAQIDAGALSGIAAAGLTGTYLEATNLSQLVSALQQIAASISCCGNGQIDAGELCDPQIPAGQSGACPTDCDDGDPCTYDHAAGGDCSVQCAHTPIAYTTSGDGCCPTGATSATDNDCPASCGNGVLDSGELCDPQIPAGQTGACAGICDDGDPCTTDAPTGGACNPTCSSTAVAPDPGQADSCCPPGLTKVEDADCKPPCGPDVTTDCIDLCKGMQCPDGQYCQWGQCVPWDASGDEAGCDCRVGTAGLPTPALALALLGLLALLRRRR